MQLSNFNGKFLNYSVEGTCWKWKIQHKQLIFGINDKHLEVMFYRENLDAALAQDHATSSTLKILFIPATETGKNWTTKPLVANKANNINFFKMEHTYGHIKNNNMIYWLRRNCCRESSPLPSIF